jgi:hypothetical protein
MLKLDPNERCTVLQAIKHPYLAKYYSEDDEVNGVEFKDTHEEFDYSVNEWKKLIYIEIIHTNKSKNSQFEISFDDQKLPN